MSRLSSFFSVVRERKWFFLSLALALVAIGYVVWPSPPPEVIIQRNLHSWAERFSKTASEEGSASQADSSPGLIQGYGHVNRLVRDAFSEEAQIHARSGGSARSRKEILQWSFTLHNKADSILIELKDIQINVNAQTKKEATVILTGTLQVGYRGRSETQSWRCDLDMALDPKDKEWRISRIVAEPVRIQTDTPPAS